MKIAIYLPIRTQSEANLREHWAQRARRAKAQREEARLRMRMAIAQEKWPPETTFTVTLTRIAPRRLDGDNNQRALKHIRDGVADVLGIDDGDRRIQWRYDQRKGRPKQYAVLLELEWD